MRHALLLAIALTAFAAPARPDPAFSCTFTGGRPGLPDSDGDPGSVQPNGVLYRAEAATLRDAARAARLACAAGEPAGDQGCVLLGCSEGPATGTDAPAPRG
jgi:hypothetical protein